MAHTNSTTNYALPQFLSTDKPAWLTDVNPAYTAIDTGIHNAQVAADAAQGDATQALSDAAAADGKATTADGKASGAVASIAESFDATSTYSVGEYVMYNNLLYVCTTTVTTPGPWTGSTNWTRTTVDSITTSLSNTIDNLNIEDLADVNLSTSDNGKLLGVSVIDNVLSIGSVNPYNLTSHLKTKSIAISNASGTTWGNHYYCDIDISGYFTGDEANATVIGVFEGTATNGGILQIMLQDNRTLRLLNDTTFSNMSLNAIVLYIV